ncbi:MAG: flagellar biosynthesis protein FlhF [Methylococcales bacterium]|nr:flagellar biosynthesis protein FlhF [Methylococcales bacterium]
MNIKRIVEIDTRTAMDKVRELFGDDAVILSNKKLGKKVEIIAAIDLEDGVVDFNQSKSATIGKESTDHEYESFFKVMQNQNNPVDYQTLSAEAHYKAQQQITNHGHQPHQSFTAIDRRHSQHEGSPVKLRAGNKGHSGSTTPSIKLNNGKKTPELKSTVKATTKIKKTTTPKTALSKNKRKTQSNAKKTTPIENNKAQNIEPIIEDMNAQNSKSDQIIESMSTELSTLRNLIESHFQNSNTTDSPIESEAILQHLQSLGFSDNIINTIKQNCLMASDSDLNWFSAEEWLTEHINISSIDPVREGGVFAFVGMAGVGKSTTIAKIASQYAMTNGMEKIALLTLDHNRIGAKEQMKLVGFMLGIEVCEVLDKTELAIMLNTLNDYDLILIDTPGNNFQNDDFIDTINVLNSDDVSAQIFLTLSANSQSKANELFCNTLAKETDGVIITKTDEALNLGEILSTVIESESEIVLLTDGQQIPNDLHRITAKELLQSVLERKDANLTAIDLP